jgi:hypothetical protein
MLLGCYSSSQWSEIQRYVEKDDAVGLEAFMTSRSLDWERRGPVVPYYQDAYQETILSSAISCEPRLNVLRAVVARVSDLNEDCHWFIENRWNPIGRTALCLSIRVGNDYATELLLKHGADPFDDTIKWVHPLVTAAREEWSSRVAAIVWITRQMPMWRDLASDLIAPWLYSKKDVLVAWGDEGVLAVEWKRRKIDI